MRCTRICLLFFLLICSVRLQAQGREQFIYSKEGEIVMNRLSMLNTCLRALNKTAMDSVAVGVCNCQLNSIDRNFTKAQYKAHTKNNIIDLESLIAGAPSVEKNIRDCYKASGKTTLLSLGMAGDKILNSCIEDLRASTHKKTDSLRLRDFCGCQLELIKTRQLSDTDLKALNDPNSLLFFEMMYKCGSPYVVNKEENSDWSSHSGKDVRGPAVDTLPVLAMQGMSYLKIRIGSQLLVWLMDSGATDLLITGDMEAMLKDEHVLSPGNYLGTTEYEMANGMIDTCRRYRVNNIRIGKFSIDNVMVSVSDRAKRILAGRSLLNKFSSWALDNKNNTLLLAR